MKKGHISIYLHLLTLRMCAGRARAPALSAGRTHVFISIVRYFMGFARPCTSARKLVCNWRQESLHCWRDKARLPFVLFNRKMVKEIAYLPGPSEGLKIRGGSWITVVGIICPPGWDRVNGLAKNLRRACVHNMFWACSFHTPYESPILGLDPYLGTWT